MAHLMCGKVLSKANQTILVEKKTEKLGNAEDAKYNVCLNIWMEVDK